MTPVEFLNARLDEVEQAAKAPIAETQIWQGWQVDGQPHWEASDGAVHYSGSNMPVAVGPWGCGIADGAAAHIAYWDPHRVLAWCESMRKLIGRHELEWRERPSRVIGEADDPYCDECLGEWWPCPTLRLLAAMFSDHPDYQESWRS